MKAYNKESMHDPLVEECTGGADKYKPFDVTGVEMMKSYQGRLALLPGTFESLYDQLRIITFDSVLVKGVTAQLQELQEVFSKLHAVMGDCSDAAAIVIDHHNYYGFSGHQGFPNNAKDAKKASKENPEMMELADWGHLEPGASQSLNP